MNANIQFDNIGAKNLTEMVIDTVWMLTFPNGTSNQLSCPGTGNSCSYVFPEFTIDVMISSDRLDDSAIININCADYNFTITHTFYTQGVSVPQMKIFNFHYIQSKNTEKVYYTIKPVLSGHGIIGDLSKNNGRL